MAKRNTYQGPERRIHKVYVTRNTEYHVRKGVCVAVRPRKAKEWVPTHSALEMKIEGHVAQGTLMPMPGAPKLGTRIYFASREDDVLTSPVIAILRPPKAVVAQYPKQRKGLRRK